MPCQFIDPLRESFGDEVPEGRGKEVQTVVEALVAESAGNHARQWRRA